jgi:F-type H+-transporting ATPase subunit delta
MNRGIISTRYAKALLSYALEKGAEENVYLQMSQLSKSFFEVPDLDNSLTSPIHSQETKISLVKTAAGGVVSDEFIRFTEIVFCNKREYLLQSIALAYIFLYHKYKNISICSLITAVPTSNDVEEKVKKLITGKTHGSVELEKSVDSDIQGGFIFELNFNRLDASVSTQLNRIRKQFLVMNNR